MTCKQSHGEAYVFRGFLTDLSQRIFLAFTLSHVPVQVSFSSCVLGYRVLRPRRRCQYDLRRDLQQHLTSRSRLPCSWVLVLL